MMVAASRRENRFQVLIGVVVLLLAAASVAQAAYFFGKMTEQQDCIATAFQRQNEVLVERTRFSNRESELTRDAMLAFSEAAEHPKANNQKELIAALLNYKQEIKEVAQDRRKTPLPKLPEGVCR